MLFLFGLLAVASAPANAAASPASVKAGGYIDVTGPRLAGWRVVWAQRRADGGLDLRATDMSSKRPRTLFAGPNPDRYDTQVRGYLAGSPTVVLFRRLTVSRSGLGEPDAIADLGTLGVFGGELRQLAPGCAAACFPIAVNADSARVLFSGPEPGRVTVKDVSSGASSIREATGPHTALAGRFLAYVSGERDVVIYDLQASRELYRVRGPAYLASLDVQEDGKVVVAYRDRQTDEGHLAWASPTSPVPHVLPLVGRPGYTALISGDRIVFSRLTADARDGEIGEIAVGGRGKVLVRPAVTPDLDFHSPDFTASDRYYDFDGGRLTWMERSCSGQRVAVSSMSSLRAAPRLRRPRCRLLLNGRVSVTSRALLVDISCRGFRRGCVSNDLTFRTTRAYRLAGRRIARGTSLTRDFRAGGDRSFPTHLGLSRLGRRLLETHRHLRASVSGRVQDFDGPLYVGFYQRRATTVTLRTR